MKEARRIESKKGLLVHKTWTPTFEELGWKLVPGDKPGEYRMLLTAQDPEPSARQLALNLKLHAADMIEGTGQDPANWRSIIRNSTVADEAFFGARVIQDLNDAERMVQKLSEGLDPLGRARLWKLVLALLGMATELHKMEVAVDETALAAQATRPMGGKMRGAQRSNPSRDDEILKAFNEKAKERIPQSNSAARKSDTAIIEEIAKELKKRKTSIGSPSGVRKAMVRARARAGQTTKKSRT